LFLFIGKCHFAPHAALRRLVRRLHARLNARVPKRAAHARAVRGVRPLHLQAQPSLFVYHYVRRETGHPHKHTTRTTPHNTRHVQRHKRVPKRSAHARAVRVMGLTRSPIYI